MSIVVKNINELDLQGSYTYKDYLTWQVDEMLELIKGKIFRMSPAPRSRHQRIASNIHGELYPFFKKQPCKIFEAPFDVRFPDKNGQIRTVVQPDICIICEPSKIDELGCLGAPDFIVEILSPSTEKKDLREKYDLYEESGVKEYWVVNPDAKSVQIFLLNSNGKYEEAALYLHPDHMREAVPLLSFEGKAIQMEDIFQV
jgi:Uma2 family endonuclease